MHSSQNLKFHLDLKRVLFYEKLSKGVVLTGFVFEQLPGNILEFVVITFHIETFKRGVA